MEKKCMKCGKTFSPDRKVMGDPEACPKCNGEVRRNPFGRKGGFITKEMMESSRKKGSKEAKEESRERELEIMSKMPFPSRRRKS